MSRMSWSRYEGRAPAQPHLTGAARDAQLEDFVRLQNPHLTDVRLEQATVTDGDRTARSAGLQWYRVTYVGDDGEGHTTAR